MRAHSARSIVGVLQQARAHERQELRAAQRVQSTWRGYEARQERWKRQVPTDWALLSVRLASPFLFSRLLSSLRPPLSRVSLPHPYVRQISLPLFSLLPIVASHPAGRHVWTPPSSSNAAHVDSAVGSVPAPSQPRDASAALPNRFCVRCVCGRTGAVSCACGAQQRRCRQPLAV